MIMSSGSVTCNPFSITTLNVTFENHTNFFRLITKVTFNKISHYGAGQYDSYIFHLTDDNHSSSGTKLDSPCGQNISKCPTN